MGGARDRPLRAPNQSSAVIGRLQGLLPGCRQAEAVERSEDRGLIRPPGVGAASSLDAWSSCAH